MTTNDNQTIDKSVNDTINRISNQDKQNNNANQGSGKPLLDPSKIGLLNDITIQLSIEIGRATIKIGDLLNLSKDSVIDLNKLAGEPVDIYANGKLIAKGNIITANGKYCVKLTSIPEGN